MGTTIHCPSCRNEFELSAAMRSGLEAEVRAAMAREFEEQERAPCGPVLLLGRAGSSREREQRLELDLEHSG